LSINRSEPYAEVLLHVWYSVLVILYAMFSYAAFLLQTELNLTCENLLQQNDNTKNNNPYTATIYWAVSRIVQLVQTLDQNHTIYNALVCFQMFFGMVRQSCGGDDHPSANQFLYAYRLLSVSSLIKSPARASIQTEPVRLLADIQSTAVSRPLSMLLQLQQRLQLVLSSCGNADVCGVNGVSGQGLADLTFAAAAVGADCIPDDGLDELMIAADEDRCLADLAFASAATGTDCIPDDGLDELMVAAGETGELMMTCDMELMDSAECTQPHGDLALTCSSDGCVPEDSVLYYVAGYIAFKLKQFTQCTQCIETVVNRFTTDCDQARLVVLRSRGGLQFPSANLLALLSLTEHCLRQNAATVSAQLYRYTIDDVLNSDVHSCMIGCDNHSCSLTSRAVHHYVLTRVHFLNRSRNRGRASRHEKHKLAKISKLT